MMPYIWCSDVHLDQGSQPQPGVADIGVGLQPLKVTERKLGGLAGVLIGKWLLIPLFLLT